MRRIHRLTLTALLAASGVLIARPAHAYVDLAPTLSRVILDSQSVALVEVVSFNRDSHVLVLKVLRSFKGDVPDAALTQDVSGESSDAHPGAVARPILQWASPGAHAVLFGSRSAALVCLGTGWYQVNRNSDNPWKLGKDRPDLPLTYYGTVSRLAEAIDQMLSGKSAIITAVAHGADDEAASFDLALNRQDLPGIVRLQRLRADMDMPGRVMAASANPAYFIGDGQVDQRDIPTLMERLKNPDQVVRAEAADDLRSLGHKARSAAPALAALLTDPGPRARFAAAAALLCVTPKDPRGVPVIAAGLDSADMVVRRAAVAAAGFAGSQGAALSDPLARLLKDPDESVRIGALQAISMLGPSAASSVPAVIPLLDDPEMAVDAADALGRIGAAATPALPRLAKMLQSPEHVMQLAALRGMAQIGGAGAHPAVDYISHALRSNPSEADAYNMMIYLALLGPVAKDAIPAIQASGLKNPMLPAATVWAINPTQVLPWQSGGMGFFGGALGAGRRGRNRGAGAGGPGMGGPPGVAGFGNLYEIVYQNYVHELGTRLRPAAPLLAKAIMNDSAGDVPLWGYRILAAGPDLALAILTPHLADKDLTMRERATVAIGYMGESAAPAKEPLESALQKAPTDREKLLLQWALREINPD